MFIFDRFITPNLKKRIAVFKKNKNGTYTHKTYGSLLEMPDHERMEYIMNELKTIGPEAVEEQIWARYNYVKDTVARRTHSERVQHVRDF